MGVGKYSPTVSHSYAIDQKWWERNGGGYGNGSDPESELDNDGYDSYGYSGELGNGVDRAGHTEFEYASNYEFNEESDELEYPLNARINSEWRNVALGDLNDYTSLHKVISDNGIDSSKFRLYQEFILKNDIKTIGTHSIYVHKDSIETMLGRYQDLGKPKEQKRGRKKPNKGFEIG